MMMNTIERSIVILDVTCEKVKSVIHLLNNSSSGWDEIPTFLVNKCVDSFMKPLTYLLNSSISGCIFPSELELARLSYELRCLTTVVQLMLSP